MRLIFRLLILCACAGALSSCLSAAVTATAVTASAAVTVVSLPVKAGALAVDAIAGEDCGEEKEEEDCED